ncbi:MAG: EAL domain-containing protein [Porticoccaceae bacterium]|nr:EAL domain-containing protein [Porticoccaceae bacterium]
MPNTRVAIPEPEGKNLLGQHVLVTDDDHIAREIAKALLEEQGFIVSLAENGLDMLAQFEADKPNLILLDVEMPEMGGFEACGRLRAMPGGENIPVIMMTGRDDAEAIEQAYEAQATDFVSKPVNWTILVQRIRYLLRAAKTFTELERSQLRLLSAQQMANLGYWDWDLSNDKLYFSEQASQIVGHPFDATSSVKKYMDVIHKEDLELFIEEVDSKALKGKPLSFEYRVITAEGEIRCIRNVGEASAVNAENKPTWYMGTVLDLTEQRRNEETIRRMAFYDAVTGLHNRTAFMEELTLLLSFHKRTNTPLAVIYLDIDDFKRVNDSMGHHVGDGLLKQFADRLVLALRSSDLAARSGKSDMLARLGGDEFTLLLSGLRDQADAAIVAKRIHEMLEEPFLLDAGTGTSKHELYVGASIGIAVYPNDGVDTDELLKNADTAMYEAKRGGKNTYRFYLDDMNDRALERLNMESGLRGALDKDELSLDYQPQIDLNTGQIIGVEALLRWNSLEFGVIPPDEFIPLAEDTGQIITIGAWALETACAQLKQWQEQGQPALKVAVNLSSLQFRYGSKLETMVATTLEKTGLEAKYLELELTESVMMSDVDKGIVTLEALKAMGVIISIDDFGAGYSSLMYLQRFPVDTLKIDRSFVQGLGVNEGDAAIANAIIVMGKSLGFTIIAEGVEEEAQLQFLQDKGCDVAQGYLFSHPIPGDQIPAFLEQFDRDAFVLRRSAVS